LHWVIALFVLVALAAGAGLALASWTPPALADEVAIAFATIVITSFILWGVSLLIWRDFEIHPTNITEESITLTNVSSRFVNAVARQQGFTEPA
jgi:hypothetical protein